MMRLLLTGAKRALGLHRPGRGVDVFPDDVFLVSYPKSGNTWTRFLIANLAYPEKNVDFTNVNEVTPDPEALSKRRLARLPRPRILKSHQYFDPRYPKVICIVRDPRDVLVSEYHFGIKRRLLADGFPIEEYAHQFVRREDHPYGNWGDNVGSWFYLRRNSPEFLLVHYEALLSNGMEEMGRISDFLGIARDRERIRVAIERSSADRMRALEKKQSHLWSSTKETRQDRPFVRAANAGAWRSELTAVSVAVVESAWGALMKDLGYELTVSAPVPAAVK
jgi:hypothetical protein